MSITKNVADRREEILRIVALHGGKNVRVFGSASRGDDERSSESDVDILVELEPRRSLLDLVAINQDLEDLLGCKVDVVTEAALSPYIREQVLGQAVNL